MAHSCRLKKVSTASENQSGHSLAGRSGCYGPELDTLLYLLYYELLLVQFKVEIVDFT